MENKVIKNMEYWKKKNNIPGVEALADSGLTDGRAGSSAFQMATPGSSPNKFIGGMVKNIGQGLIGKGKMGFLNPAMWAARGVKNTLDADPTTTNVFGGGTGDQALGGVFGGGQPQVPQPAMAAQPQMHQPPLAMKSPLEQEEMMMDEKPVDPTEKIYVEGDYKEGDLVMEDDFESQFKRTGNDPKDYPQLSVQDYSEIKVDEKGMYVQKLKKDEEIKGLEMGGVGEIKPGM